MLGVQLALPLASTAAWPDLLGRLGGRLAHLLHRRTGRRADLLDRRTGRLADLVGRLLRVGANLGGDAANRLAGVVARRAHLLAGLVTAPPGPMASLAAPPTWSSAAVPAPPGPSAVWAVGEDSTGNIIWEDWRPSDCDPARDISPGWWYEREHASLTDFLGRAIPAFTDPDRLPAPRLQMMLDIAATSDRGFVEQRVMMGAAGLEHIMWQTLVLEGEMSERQYRNQDAHEKLRRLLTEAQIPTDIDGGLLPITARLQPRNSVARERSSMARTWWPRFVIGWCTRGARKRGCTGWKAWCRRCGF